MLTRRLDPEAISGLPPGSHVVFLSESPLDGIQGRRFGLELRDTLLILTPMGNRFAFLFRKAVEGTVAENVLRHGCGGLNIDACRVRGVVLDKERRTSPRGDTRHVYWKLGVGPTGERHNNTGRWPSNLVLVHHIECKETGTRKVRSGNSNLGVVHGSGDDVTFLATKKSSAHYASPDGLETIQAWKCAESCPVRELDEQGGMLKSGVFRAGAQRAQGGGYRGGFTGAVLTRDFGGDARGASRFFPQFKDEGELRIWLQVLIGGPPAPESV